MSLSDTVKQAAIEAVLASNPVNILPGTIIKTNPLEVNADQRFNLTEDFLIVPERLIRYTATIDGQEVVIRSGLKSGDKVLLIRVQGGQQYVIFDKVGVSSP